jgi:hypothetical protein
LGDIAQHALVSEIKCLENERDKAFATRLLPGERVRLAVIRMGQNEFKNVFTQEFLDKMGFKP